MNHEMRRKDRAMDAGKMEQILKDGEYGVMASVDGENQPYATPLSYIYDGKAVYFHCARTGHKIENIENNANVCFNVVGKVQAVYTDSFTTRFESVVVFGKALKVAEDEKKIDALRLLCEKYLPAHMDKFDENIKSDLHHTAVYQIAVERMTGKEKR